MKTKMNVLKYSILGLVILFAAGELSAQKVTGEQTGKEIIKGGQKGGKEDVKNGEVATDGGGKAGIKGDPKGGKADIKGEATDGKNAIKNPNDPTGNEGSVGGATDHGSSHTGGTHSDGQGGVTEVGGEGMQDAGGAYMRDKSNEGKPYDQVRLDAAKANCQKVIDAATAAIAAEEQHVQVAKSKIQEAQAAVTAMKADKKADPAVIASKEGAIATANAMVAQLEQQIGTVKGNVDRAKALLTPAVAAK
jgi:hypothetical protein